MTIDLDNLERHPFEIHGLGRAPYRYLGREEKVHQVPGSHPKAGSTCDFCSTPIRNAYWLRSACGAEFKVGSECINKSGDRHLAAKARKAETKARKARELARIRAIATKVKEGEAFRAELASRPHPNAYRADQGKTMLDYAEFIFTRGGHAGMLKLTRDLEKL